MWTSGADSFMGNLPGFLERNLLKILYGFLAGATLIVAGAIAFSTLRPVQVVPRYGPIAPFQLLDQRGNRFDQGLLLGRFTVFSFLATKGDAVAEETLASLQKLRASLARSEIPPGRVLLVTVSLDPEGDTPAVLSELANRQGATPSQWVFLTGNPADVYDLATLSLGVFYRKDHDPSGTSVVHTSRFVLVDQNGNLRSSYEGPRLDTDRIIRDLKLLDREASAQGVSRYVYEAAHILLCYPR